MTLVIRMNFEKILHAGDALNAMSSYVTKVTRFENIFE